MLRSFKKALASVDYKLWFALLISMLFPSIYQTVRVFFLGELPHDLGINIASQLSWVSLVYEVVQEAILLPLFFLLGEALTNRTEFGNRIRTGLISTVFTYMIVTSVFIAFSKPLVHAMGQDPALFDETITYVRIESIGLFFSVLFRFILLVFILLKKERYLYYMLFLQMTVSILADTFLVSTLPFSVDMGVNGIAISNILVHTILSGVGLFLLHKEEIPVFTRAKMSFAWQKKWFAIRKYSGLESLIRNFVFVVLIIRMTNLIAEQGNYWLANNFIWNWLLLPALALSALVKKEISENEQNITHKTYGYLAFALVMAVGWLLSIPLWIPFLRYVMNIADYNVVYTIVLLQTGFYLTFILNSCILDSTFYALGKTNYMLIQSICIDVFYYGIVFILYAIHVFEPSLMRIALVFGIGMFLDFIPTLILYRRLLKAKALQINFKL